MRKLIIITVALILLLGGSLAAVVFVIGNFEALSSAEVVVELTPGHVQMDNVTIPVVAARALDHYVSIDLRFELFDDRRLAEFEEQMPYVRDAILREVHRVVPMREDGIASVDILWLKDRARAIANEVLHDDIVGRVMLTRVVRVIA